MIKPINDFILVKEIDEYQEKTIGTIVIESGLSNEDSDMRLKKFEVIEISDGYINPQTNSERKINENIKPGTIIIMDKFSGKKVRENGEEYTLVREVEIQGIIKEDK